MRNKRKNIVLYKFMELKSGVEKSLATANGMKVLFFIVVWISVLSPAILHPAHEDKHILQNPSLQVFYEIYFTFLILLPIYINGWQ